MEELTLMFLMGLVLGALIGAFIVCSFVVSKESEQNDIINKAIEYIEILEYNQSYGIKAKDYTELLDILKGVDKE